MVGLEGRRVDSEVATLCGFVGWCLLGLELQELLALLATRFILEWLIFRIEII